LVPATSRSCSAWFQSPPQTTAPGAANSPVRKRARVAAVMAATSPVSSAGHHGRADRHGRTQLQ
jgi:hypothetical protein